MSAFSTIASGAVLVMLLDVLVVRDCTWWNFGRLAFNDFNRFGGCAFVCLVTARVITLSWFQLMWMLCMVALSEIPWGLHFSDFSRFGVGACCKIEWLNFSVSTKFWGSSGPGFPTPKHWPQNDKCAYPNKKWLILTKRDLSQPGTLKKWLKAIHIVWKTNLATQVQAFLVCNWRLFWLGWALFSWNSTNKYWNSGFVMILSCDLVLIPTRTLCQGGDVVHITTIWYLSQPIWQLFQPERSYQEAFWYTPHQIWHLSHLLGIILWLTCIQIGRYLSQLERDRSKAFVCYPNRRAIQERLSAYPGAIWTCISAPSEN